MSQVQALPLLLQDAAERLRQVEILECQNRVEREVELMNTLKHERTLDGAASSTSRNIQSQIKRSRKRCVEALASWQAWHDFLKPPREQPVPYIETEILQARYRNCLSMEDCIVSGSFQSHDNPQAIY